jgi:hypothetical protein
MSCSGVLNNAKTENISIDRPPASKPVFIIVLLGGYLNVSMTPRNTEDNAIQLIVKPKPRLGDSNPPGRTVETTNATVTMIAMPMDRFTR